MSVIVGLLYGPPRLAITDISLDTELVAADEETNQKIAMYGL